MPEKTPPTFDKYDCSIDPDDHMRAFVNAMAFYSNSDSVLCRAFSLSLRGEAFTWYNTLPPNTLDCFATVQTLFERQYASSRIQEFTSAELVNTKQEKDESPKAFMKRYKAIQKKAAARNLWENKKEGKRSFNGDPPQKDPMHLPRFNHYTTLNAPRAKVLEEALNVELLTFREKVTPNSSDARKICNFHLNCGHTTEECNILKVEIERLIRGGHLQQFVRKERTQTRSPTRETGRSHQKTEQGRRHSRSRSRSLSRERNRSVRRYINTISRGFAGGGTSLSARKRHLRRLKTVHMVDRKPRSLPPITFTDEDFHAPDPNQDYPMVITAEISRSVISKVLIDQGERVDTRGYLDLRTQLGTDRETKEFRIRFLLVKAHTPYNALLGRPCLKAFGAVVSTPHLALKFPCSAIRPLTLDHPASQVLNHPTSQMLGHSASNARPSRLTGARSSGFTSTQPSALTGIQPLGLCRPSSMASNVQAFSRSTSQVSSTRRFFRNSWATDGHSDLLGDSLGTLGPRTVTLVYWEVLQELLGHGQSLTSTGKFFRNS
ncbi:uncharacterized protein LOC124832100 [Vigna umbellata]|uniref:uncharacterized protein LOC124832100 n=1 Tax=Vigna umbellata TaxID=87088 RepID=UPI001F5F586E|nr:uncharacterized protein LOC124832100 [Vigna umbellata]